MQTTDRRLLKINGSCEMAGERSTTCLPGGGQVPASRRHSGMRTHKNHLQLCSSLLCIK